MLDRMHALRLESLSNLADDGRQSSKRLILLTDCPRWGMELGNLNGSMVSFANDIYSLNWYS